MKVYLAALSENEATAWSNFCGQYDFVEVIEGDILALDVDAVVSPANSFGFMDGGIDKYYLEYFGRELQTRVRDQIAKYHDGEMLVGKADIVETHHLRIPYLIVAPTMRVPMKLVDSVNPYLAARAILLMVRDGVF